MRSAAFDRQEASILRITTGSGWFGLNRADAILGVPCSSLLFLQKITQNSIRSTATQLAEHQDELLAQLLSVTVKDRESNAVFVVGEVAATSITGQTCKRTRLTLSR